MNWTDLSIVIAYLVGTTLFGCSFFFRKRGSEDGARAFMTGGGSLPTWAIALSVFATHVSSISFLALPEGAYGPENWRGWVNSITVPIATLAAAAWFVPFYRRSVSVSAYSFLERRFGTWARIYASACFLIMQSARSGVILLLLAILVNQLLGFPCETIIVVTGMATLLYSMLGGFAAVVWADAVQSVILIGGTLVCVVCLVLFTPDIAANARIAWDAGKLSLGSLSPSDWSTNTFWVLFAYSICINLQNFGVDQCYTQRYVAAKDEAAAKKSIWGSACLYVPVTLLFTAIGTLLWMYDKANPGVIPEGMRPAAVFPWFIVHKLPTGVSGLLVAAIIAAAMSTVAATLNSGSTVLLEDYWKRFAPAKANGRTNLVFLRLMTVVLAAVAIGIALVVIWCTKDTTILSAWWTIQGVFSGGMLGLFLIGAFSRRTRAVHAMIAVTCGFVAMLWTVFGQRVLPLPKVLHVNLSLVFATLAIVTVGFVLGQLSSRLNRFLRTIQTVRHLKLVQVVNRLWRKLPGRRAGEVRGMLTVRKTGDMTFPNFFTVWDGQAAFTFLNETHDVRSAADWNHGGWKKLWLYNLHYFDCLRQEGADPRACASLINRWIDENPVGKGNGWEPYPVSLRVVNWIKWLMREGSGAAGDRVLPSLFLQVRWLRRRLEYHLLGNHLLANAKALVFAGCFFEGAEADEWLRKGLSVYRKELPEQVLEDGVHFERSAMYHCIMLEDVLDCCQLAGEGLFGAYAAKMLDALRLLTGPDGKIVKFNDAAEGIALPVKTLTEYGERMVKSSDARKTESPKGVESVASGRGRTSGFVRLEKGEWCVIAKMGEIGPSYQPGHAHADTGTFELWKGERKIVTDTGTDRYVIDDERKRQRGSAAHNVVTIDGQDSSEVWAGHRVARRARPLSLTVNEADGRVEGTYRDCRGYVITRRLRLTERGLEGEDVVDGQGEHEVEVRFHLKDEKPDIRVSTALSDPLPQRFSPCPICEEYGKQVSGRVCASGGKMRLPTTIKWSIVI